MWVSTGGAIFFSMVVMVGKASCIRKGNSTHLHSESGSGWPLEGWAGATGWRPLNVLDFGMGVQDALDAPRALSRNNFACLEPALRAARAHAT